MEENKLEKMYLIQTDTCCFISDCMKFSGYDFTYHQSELPNLFFDGEKAELTFAPNWLKIKKFPKKIERSERQPDINKRYEIRDKALMSKSLLEIIKIEEKENYGEDVLGLYDFKSDKQPDITVEVKYDIDIVLNITNYEEPKKIDYNAIQRSSWNDETIKITDKDIKHQLLDKIIFPEILLPTRPCSISSINLYSIIRQHIRENINTKVAEITSDYAFCFAVKKIMALIEPRKFTYNNLFAPTKKGRAKIRFGVQEYKKIEIFEMTHTQENYKSYTPVKELFADSETELKGKIDNLLQKLITAINEPLEMCKHCKGTGYTKEIQICKI